MCTWKDADPELRHSHTCSHLEHSSAPCGHSQVCREKCFLSEGPVVVAVGGATAREEEGGRGMAVTTVGGSAPWANRCWMECSWKQGSANSTVAALSRLQGETENSLSMWACVCHLSQQGANKCVDVNKAKVHSGLNSDHRKHHDHVNQKVHNTWLV